MLPYALVGALGAYLYYSATQMDFHRRAGTLGPDFWPKLILGLLIAVCLYALARALLARGRAAGATGLLQEMVESAEAKGAEGYAHAAPKSLPLLIAGVALTAFYVWIIQRLGFVLATAPYLAVFIALGGYRRWGVNAVVSVAGTLLMMFFFMKVVYVSLPIGREPFAQVTLALMQLMGIR